jgi:hypothetical protein
LVINLIELCTPCFERLKFAVVRKRFCCNDVKNKSLKVPHLGVPKQKEIGMLFGWEHGSSKRVLA